MTTTKTKLVSIGGRSGCAASGGRGNWLLGCYRPADACQERQRVGGHEEHADGQDGEQSSEAQQGSAAPQEAEQRRTLEEAMTHGEDGDAKREAAKQHDSERQARQPLRLHQIDGSASSLVAPN